MRREFQTGGNFFCTTLYVTVTSLATISNRPGGLQSLCPRAARNERTGEPTLELGTGPLGREHKLRGPEEEPSRAARAQECAAEVGDVPLRDESADCRRQRKQRGVEE